jgi:ABC-2 type transport system permease protein
MIALRAALKYELRMQLRKPSLWITMAVLTGFTLATSGTLGLGMLFGEPDPRAAMVFAGRLVMLFLPIGFGSLLADRLVRDEQLNVRQVLDATPGGLTGRLGGKYLGACLAGAIPLVGCYLLLALAYVVWRGEPAALGYLLAITAAVFVPALLFVGAFAMLCPLVMPAPLFRVLFTGYWFWTHLIDPAAMPTLNGTLLNPVNGYAMDVFFHSSQGDLSGEVPGAALNLLRPAPTTATALLSLAVLLAMAALALGGARALLDRTAR